MCKTILSMYHFFISYVMLFYWWYFIFKTEWRNAGFEHFALLTLVREQVRQSRQTNTVIVSHVFRLFVFIACVNNSKVTGLVCFYAQYIIFLYFSCVSTIIFPLKKYIAFKWYILTLRISLKNSFDTFVQIWVKSFYEIRNIIRINFKNSFIKSHWNCWST